MAGNSLIGNLAVLLSMDTSAFERGSTHAQRLMRQTQRQFQQMGQNITRAGQALSIGITAPFALLMRTAIPAAIESRQAIGQVNAALASMGPAAGRSAAQLQALAEQLQRTSTFDDDDILRQVTANLLTFGRVSTDVFDRAQQSIVNISARMGTDLQSAAMMLGRALNDPVRGMNALRRSGIQFTTAQQATIRAMMATNNIAGAQRVMLDELENQFGGAAQALRDASPGAELNERWRTFQEVVGEIALRVLPPLTGFLTRMLEVFQRLSPEMQTYAVGAVAIAAALGPVLMIVGPLVSAMGALLPVIAGLAPAVTGLAAAWGVAGVASGGLGVAIAGLLPEIAILAGAAALVISNWGRIAPILTEAGATIAAALGPSIREMIDGLSQSLNTLWSGPLGDALRDLAPALRDLMSALVPLVQALAAVFGPMVISMIRTWLAAFTGVVQAVADWVNVVVALFRGDWAGAWNSAVSLVSNLLTNLGRVILAIAPNIVGSLRSIYEGARSWLVDRMNALVNLVLAPIRAIEAGFRWLYDRVVGHSHIPDMVNEIGQHMARLDAVMVRPAQNAAARTEAAFRETSELLDQLFPEMRRALDYQNRLAAIGRQTSWSPAMRSAAEERAFQQNLASLGDQGQISSVEDGTLEASANILSEAARQGEQALDQLADHWQAAQERMGAATRDLGRTINSTLVNGLQGLMRGFGSLKDIALNVLYSIGDALIENVFSRIGGAGGSSGGGLGGIIANAVGGLISGKRALGGPVMAGRGYIVGERGPEWFQPGSSGAIVPNHRLAGRAAAAAGDITIHQHYRFEGVAITQDQFVAGLSMSKADTINSIRELQRRRA